MTTKISGTGFDELVVDNLVLSNPLQEQYGGSGSTGVYKMGYATPKSATGTSVDFTGIPSWAKRITVMFSGVSTNGTSSLLIQLGDSGGIESTGYIGSSFYFSTGGSNLSNTSGFFINTAAQATTLYGKMIIDSLSQSLNLWIEHANMVFPAGALSFTSTGEKTLTDKLTQIRITTVNGTDLFDAGTINVMWEGFV